MITILTILELTVNLFLSGLTEFLQIIHKITIAWKKLRARLFRLNENRQRFSVCVKRVTSIHNGIFP